MSKAFTRVGKQVMANGFHYADAADETAAQYLLEALQLRAIMQMIWHADSAAAKEAK